MDIGWKVVSAGAGIVSGLVANKAVDVLWKGITGKQSPREDDNLIDPLREVLVFSVISAAVGAAINQVVIRRTAKWYGMDRALAAMGKGVAQAQS
ncbi:MAG: DUF4235 domain-containing protein [Actinomycetaceae bacterium]|nr:DUF4235 domain-containing protein [Actinomycetaceae bacterium]